MMLPEMVKHVSGGVSRAGKCKLQHMCGKKEKKKWEGYFKTNQEEDGKVTEPKCLLKIQDQSLFFSSSPSPEFVGCLPCNFMWSLFVEEILNSRHFETPEVHQGYPWPFIMRHSCSALAPPLPSTLSSPTLLWLNLIADQFDNPGTHQPAAS